MNINDFELLNRICSVINNETGTNDAAIATYLIDHLRNARAVNVTAIMEHAFVSRSAVRRFCNRLGYQSLSDLKESFSQLVFPSDLSHRDPTLTFTDYRAALDVRMLEMYADVESRVSDAEIVQLADEIHERHNVEIMCANNVSGTLTRFQQELFFTGKTVRISAGDNIAKPGTEAYALTDSLLIVVSASGLFARQIDPYAMGRRARKVLITAFCNEETARHYDKVCYLSDRGNGIDELGIYSKCAIVYFFDLLSACYISRYPMSSTAPLYGESHAWELPE